MKTVSIPWSAWYNTRKLELNFPEDWEITVSEMRGGSEIGEPGIARAFANPIGSPRLEALSKNAKSAAILVDDLSRPTPAYRLLPHIITELSRGGIPVEQIKIICALAAHRPLTRDDLIKKIGIDLVDSMHVLNHNAYENLEFLGHSSRGIPIFVNRDFMSCDLRIALGMITPRGGFFGGGSKLLLPGACGHVTITANHRYVREGFREHLDEVARMADLRFIVNPLLNAELEIIALVTGDPEAAFWKGVEYGKELYRTSIPENADVGIFNAFPKDTEFVQAGLATVPMSGTKKKLLKDGATVVICSASPEGLGWHSVLGPGTALAGKPAPPKRRTILFSPGINRWDAKMKHGEGYIFCKTWPEVLDVLKDSHGAGTRAVVFPCGALQYGGD